MKSTKSIILIAALILGVGLSISILKSVVNLIVSVVAFAAIAFVGYKVYKKPN